AWLCFLQFAATATTTAVAEFSIRQASVSGALILTMLNMLRLSVSSREQTWARILTRARTWLLCTAAVVILCQTRFFLRQATMPLPIGSGPPSPVYGDGIFAYAAFFVAAIIALIISTSRDLRRTAGGEHAELAFILIGGLSALTFTLLL